MSRLNANLLLLLAAVIWGSSFAAQKMGGEHVSALTFTAARFLLGALVVLPLAWRELRRTPISGRHWLGMTLTGCVLFVGSFMQQMGVDHTSVTNAGFITGLYVPLVPIIGFVALKVRPHPVTWPAAALCLFGTWLLSGAQSLDFQTGDLWVLVSSLFWACHVILVGRMSNRTGAPTLVAFMQFAVCGAIAVAGGLIFDAEPFTGIPDAWVEIAYVGILSVGVAFTLQSVTQQFTPAADAAIILSGETVFSAVGGVLLMGETLDGVKLAGCAAILVAMLLVQLLPGMMAQPAPQPQE
ncbi:MAG TPA: DMT family transporter [Candidatus Sulfotelmatobacter sp.]|jgi:drug/metabolite transporter (DMT)-like permease|nr:DMT family transporter [Candidatus Sulfotelmatobacter sp.]